LSLNTDGDSLDSLVFGHTIVYLDGLLYEDLNIDLIMHFFP